MTECADLEIGLHRRDAETYALELRFSPPKSDADVRLVRGGLPSARFDPERLLELALDDEDYGQLLYQSLLSDAELRTAFAQACSTAQALDVPLRLRLFIGPDASTLHGLRWEMLRDPQDSSLLFTGERILFSRYLSSLDWQPVGLRPKGDLRALVVIANPAGLGDWRPAGRLLTAVDVEGELTRAKAGLGDIPITTLASGNARLDEIAARLRDGYDILYLVCHGALLNAEPHLFLEDEARNVKVVPGAELVVRLAEIQHKPRLVILASCQSAGTSDEGCSDDGGALAALGPRLAAAGIPAVLAMQGNVTMHTVARFMPVFFQELLRDGQIDRAAAVARGAVRDRPDWWAPVLFMRLKSGRLWYVPGFGEDRYGLEKWRALLTSIQQGRCTPILGPDLTESLFGSRREIARRLAERYRFPMAAHCREDLPQVTQYLAVDQDPNFLLTALPRDLFDELQRRFDLPAELTKVAIEELAPDELMDFLDRLMRAAVTIQCRQPDRVQPYQVLAELPLPVYITTNWNNLLAEALVAARKKPKVAICPWYEGAERMPDVYDENRGYVPSEREPLVYHLYGHISDLDSLVVTEDDYFDYLIGITKNKELIPEDVRSRLVNSALLFLGFRLDDWNSRILFRSLMSIEGRGRRRRFANVAAQILPDEDRIEEPERVRRYLDEYLENADISIYWGSVDDFTRDLKARVWRGSDS